MLGEVGFYLGDDLGIVRPFGIEPENSGCLAQAGARDGKLYPILNGEILSLASAPDIAGLHFVFD